MTPSASVNGPVNDRLTAGYDVPRNPKTLPVEYSPCSATVPECDAEMLPLVLLSTGEVTSDPNSE